MGEGMLELREVVNGLRSQREKKEASVTGCLNLV